MKFLVCSDLHLRPTAPISRKDDYGAACLRKLKQLVDYSNSANIPIILPGDIGDRHEMPIWYLNKVISILSQCDDEILAIYGNHDLKNHSQDLEMDTALWNMTKAGYIFTPQITAECYYNRDSYIHLTNFGQTPTKPRPGKYNILVIHTSVFKDEVPFYMPDADTPETLEAKYPGYDLYLTGDIHIPCITDKVINTGSMMRSTIAQKDHKPCFVEVDTVTNEKIIHYFEIEEDVWRTDFVTSKEDSFSEGLQELSETLAARDEKLSYKEVAVELLKEKELLKRRMLGIMEGYNAS